MQHRKVIHAYYQMLTIKTIIIKITKLNVYTIRLFNTIFFKNQRIGVGDQS